MSVLALILLRVPSVRATGICRFFASVMGHLVDMEDVFGCRTVCRHVVGALRHVRGGGESLFKAARRRRSLEKEICVEVRSKARPEFVFALNGSVQRFPEGSVLAAALRRTALLQVIALVGCKFPTSCPGRKRRADAPAAPVSP